MTQEAATTPERPAGGIGFFEKWLSVWVALCIAAGLALGSALPGLFAGLAKLEYASVNLVVAVLIWAMVYPMMVNVDFASLRHIGDRPKGLIVTIAVNWLIKPFTMAALGVLFFEVLFRNMIAPADAQQYIAGLILLGAAPCTAMVFVWSQLTRGDATYTLVQVSVNDIIMIFAFAPIVALAAGRDEHRRAVADAAALRRPLRRDPARRGRADPPAAGRACPARRKWRGRRFPFHRRGEADLGARPAGDRRAAVRLPGAGDPATGRC